MAGRKNRKGGVEAEAGAGAEVEASTGLEEGAPAVHAPAPRRIEAAAGAEIFVGDSLDVMRRLVEAGVKYDCVLTDPPYGLSDHGDITPILAAWIAGESFDVKKKGFMGKAWDGFVPGPEYWRLCFSLLNPGGHLLAFSGARTSDLMGVSLRLAGFEVRDVITYLWTFGSGFPKSLDCAKAIDKSAGIWRGRAGEVSSENKAMGGPNYTRTPKGAAETEAAKRWEGFGTALKPAYEPVILARRPLEGTVVRNLLAHGAGALNIQACRTPCAAGDKPVFPEGDYSTDTPVGAIRTETRTADSDPTGRWPTNLVHDGSPAVIEAFASFGEKASPWIGNPSTSREKGGAFSGGGEQKGALKPESKDLGTAARYFPALGPDAEDAAFQAFLDGLESAPERSYEGDLSKEEESQGAFPFHYCGKASRADREAGLESLPVKGGGELTDRVEGSKGLDSPRAGAGRGGGRGNTHPTVKPTSLMRWLAKLACPPGGRILDPFCGSGSTGRGALLEGFSFTGIEREEEYAEIAALRIAHAAKPASGEEGDPAQLGLPF